MELIDPATSLPLPPEAIQRTLFLNAKVHIYNIPPLASTRGYVAATWTEDPRRHIFTCRMRIIETSFSPTNNNKQAESTDDDEQEHIKVDIILEDPSTGQLFAAAPYTSPAVVESALDSSRFFAVRVQDPSGRKATLGVGFEDRSDAFDFSVGLQEARKSLGLEAPPGGLLGQPQQQQKKKKGDEKEEEVKRDYSLKEGETITVSFGGSGFGRRKKGQQEERREEKTGDLNSFALPPPPGSGVRAGGGILPPPPPPPPGSGRAQRGDGGGGGQNSAKDLGFDDGQFGEFA